MHISHKQEPCKTETFPNKDEILLGLGVFLHQKRIGDVKSTELIRLKRPEIMFG